MSSPEKFPAKLISRIEKDKYHVRMMDRLNLLEDSLIRT